MNVRVRYTSNFFVFYDFLYRIFNISHNALKFNKLEFLFLCSFAFPSERITFNFFEALLIIIITFICIFKNIRSIAGITFSVLSKTRKYVHKYTY